MRARECETNRRLAMAITRVKRPTLADLDLSTGKRTRLHRLLYTFGPANGTLLFLPIDQGLEHGPRDFFPNPSSQRPRLPAATGERGQLLRLSSSRSASPRSTCRSTPVVVPLVLKLNGKTEIPAPTMPPISPLIAMVEDAVRLGADAGRLHALRWLARSRRRTSSSSARCARRPSGWACRSSSGRIRAAKPSRRRAGATASMPLTTPRAWRASWAPTSSR